MQNTLHVTFASDLLLTFECTLLGIRKIDDDSSSLQSDTICNENGNTLHAKDMNQDSKKAGPSGICIILCSAVLNDDMLNHKLFLPYRVYRL